MADLLERPPYLFWVLFALSILCPLVAFVWGLMQWPSPAFIDFTPIAQVLVVILASMAGVVFALFAEKFDKAKVYRIGVIVNLASPLLAILVFFIWRQ